MGLLSDNKNPKTKQNKTEKPCCLDVARDPYCAAFQVSLFSKGKYTHCWQMCGVDTSFWMKSFRPIFLSLMKAAGRRSRDSVLLEKHKAKHTMPNPNLSVIKCSALHL